MPDEVRRQLIRMRDGSYYLPVAARLLWFREEHPDWPVVTKIADGGYGAGYVVVQAQVIKPTGEIIATGHKSETKEDFPSGWIEKAETGAIGRALAVAGYGVQYAPELAETEPPAQIPRRPSPSSYRRSAAQMPRQSLRPVPIWNGTGQCPSCHAPEGKPHASNCKMGAQQTERSS